MNPLGILELSDVSVTFTIKKGMNTRKVEALRHVTLEFSSHELVVLLGESGSGKTTLGRVLAGLQKPTGGLVKFRGKDISKLKGKSDLEFGHAVQLVHQDPYTSLNPALSIEQSMLPALRRWTPGLTKSEARRKIGEVLGLVGLSSEDLLQKYPHQLSGGQRQRIAVARTMSINPELVILDEPVSMIDASLRIGVLDTLLEIRRRLGTAYIFITHDLAIARYFCEKGGSGRVVVLYGGSIMEAGENEQVMRSPTNPYTMALLASTPGGLAMSEDWSRKLSRTYTEVSRGCRFYSRCLYAEEICRAEEPALKPVRKGQSSACHFADDFVSAERQARRPSQQA